MARTAAAGARSERTLAIGYLAVAVILAAALLPSVLRPPQQQQQAGAAFDPNAPPDKTKQALFSGFNQAASGSPVGVVAPGNSEGPPPPPTTVPPPPIVKPNACPYGIGNPPRQFSSPYAPPCAPAWVGDNGGATSRGVTPTDINVCFENSLTGGTTEQEFTGPPQASDSAVVRTYKALHEWFNSRLQLYGRQMRWFYVGSDTSGQTSSDASNRARSDKAVDKFNCFAAIQETDPEEADQLAQRQVLTYTLAELPEKWFAGRDPYVWSTQPSGDQMVRMGAEYACKNLAGKPPTYTQESPPNITYAKPRTFGILAYNQPGYDHIGDDAAALMKQECGVDAKVVTYDLEGSAAGTQGLASAMTQMAVAGVSTIFYLGDLLSAAVFTSSATQNNYFPEWYIPGFGGVETGHIARDYDPTQWAHAFGYGFFEIPRPESDEDCYKAYHEIDPNNEPDYNMCTYMWVNMVQLFGGFQRTGAKLTVPNFKQALLAMPHLPPNPPWNMAGGYETNDHTFPDWAAELWWDPNAIGSDGQKGTYRYVRNGLRVTYGQWNAEDNGLFKTANTITTAPTGQ